MSAQTRKQRTELLYVGFNQDYGCFACGTDTGFRIYNCDPFKETHRKDFSRGGIGYAEMLFRCNILALVGGGDYPRFPLYKVMIWDDHQNRCIGELSFRSEVKAVKLRRDRVVVVLEHKIYVYNFADLKLVDHIETIKNPKGLCALCPTNTVLICPGNKQGQVRAELYDLKKTTIIPAHETSLSCIALNHSGTRVATASEKGTLIRIFDTASGNLLQELRRGADRAEIYSICFNPTSEWLAVSSDHGTIHVFKLSEAVKGDDKKSGKNKPKSQPEKKSTPEPAKTNPKSSLSFMKGILPSYFSSEWSFATYRIPDTGKTIVAFGTEENSIIVVSASGSFYKATFDPKKSGSECEMKSHHKFIKTDEGEEEE